MQVSSDLWSELSNGSKLIVVKGDLNYRRLVFDCHWPPTTPFPDALGPFRPAPLVALRTLKAEVVVGLPPGTAEAVAEVDKQWLVDGNWGVVQFAPRK